MAHARAWVETIHPGSLIIEASAVIKRIPRIQPDGSTLFEPRAMREDIWGCFDLVVCPRANESLVDLVQVTSIRSGMQNVEARKAKVGKWVKAFFPTGPPAWLGDIYVVGWVPRKHLRIWSWRFQRTGRHTFGTWREDPPSAAKLPTKVRKTAAPPPLQLAAAPDPF